MSESEEMYLVTIARLKENGVGGPIPLSQLAAELNVLPVSANQMLHKLAGCGLVDYIPYKGVNLTSSGLKQALTILRHRRLWEVFLISCLGFSSAEADQLACKMEHALPQSAVERLADYLGGPQVTPDGKAIPEPQVEREGSSDIPVIALKINEKGRISKLSGPTSIKSFLSAEGVLPGCEVTVQAIGSDQSILLKTQAGNTVLITGEIAGDIWIDSPFSTAVAPGAA